MAGEALNSKKDDANLFLAQVMMKTNFWHEYYEKSTLLIIKEPCLFQPRPSYPWILPLQWSFWQNIMNINSVLKDHSDGSNAIHERKKNTITLINFEADVLTNCNFMLILGYKATLKKIAGFLSPYRATKILLTQNFLLSNLQHSFFFSPQILSGTSLSGRKMAQYRRRQFQELRAGKH